MRLVHKALLGLTLVPALWAYNTPLLRSASGQPPLLLAHRGLAQTFPIAGLRGDEDTSKRIYPPEHPYLENTLASMAAAFDAGADLVELDVQRSADGRLAVFHDATLDYRTDGHGPVRAHTLAALKRLDVGYGYSADGGATFPFRGQGVGLMPSLEEVLERFPERAFLIDLKSADPGDGAALAAVLATLSPEHRARLAAYGSNPAIEALKRELPSFRVMSKATLVTAALAYLAVGWTGYVPAPARGTELHIPLRYAWLFWGWPRLFTRRMAAADTRVVLVAGEGPWSEGFDTLEALAQVPQDFDAVIWTNRIDRIGPRVKQRQGR